MSSVSLVRNFFAILTENYVCIKLDKYVFSWKTGNESHAQGYFGLELYRKRSC